MIDVKRLSPGDGPLIAAAGHLFDDQPRPEAVNRFLADDRNHIFIAYEDGEPVGFVTGVELTHPDKGTEMFLYELAVDERHHRRGIGTALVKALADIAKQRGCYDMWVLTDADNEAALGTYRKSGADRESTHVMLTWPFS